MKALFTYPYSQDKLKRIKDLGYEVLVDGTRDISYGPEFSDVEVLVCNNPFKSLDINLMDDLNWIQLISMGVERAPLDIIKQNNIMLTNTRGGFSTAIAEWIIAKILEIYKKSRLFYQYQKNHQWEKERDIYELINKKVLFLGTGSIARTAASRLKSFKTINYGVNTDGRAVEYFDRCYQMSEIDAVLPEADIIVLALPLTEETRELMDNNLLTKTRKDSILVNIARGGLIVEEDLIKLLQEEHFLGVALDVFAEEPLPEDNPLWDFENVLLTPHISYASENRFSRVFEIIYDNMKRYAEGKELKNIVDHNKGY